MTTPAPELEQVAADAIKTWLATSPVADADGLLTAQQLAILQNVFLTALTAAVASRQAALEQHWTVILQAYKDKTDAATAEVERLTKALTEARRIAASPEATHNRVQLVIDRIDAALAAEAKEKQS